MNHRPGVRGVASKSTRQNQIETTSKKLNEQELVHIKEHMTLFQSKLEQFALKHKDQINNDSEFRSHFMKMCATIGIDPLASKRGFWEQILGIGTFYYQLAVDVIEFCLATREFNGGMIGLDELVRMIQLTKPKNATIISIDDICQAVSKLECLSTGYTIIQLSKTKKALQFIQCEFKPDHLLAISYSQNYSGVLDLKQFLSETGWSLSRSESVFSYLLAQGIAWLDKHNNSIFYWFPSMMPEMNGSDSQEIESQSSESLSSSTCSTTLKKKKKFFLF